MSFTFILALQIINLMIDLPLPVRFVLYIYFLLLIRALSFKLNKAPSVFLVRPIGPEKAQVQVPHLGHKPLAPQEETLDS